jgi:hypothetical protein
MNESEWDDTSWDPADDDIAQDAEDEAVVLACPSCRKAVHEDTQQCPHCHDWIVPIDPDSPRTKLIWAIAAGLVITAMLLTAVL